MKPITIKRIKRKLIRTFFREQWTPVVCDLDGNVLTILTPPQDRFWADPFIAEHNGKTYIFAEQQIGSEHGTLGCVELYADLTYSDFIPILEKDYHLSFPNVFCIGQDWYMIPETHENRTIDLYKAADFPFKWKYSLTLIENITAVDSAVFYHNGKWYLFTSIDGIINGKQSSLNGNLSVFYSDTFPSNKWTSHPQNPVCSGLDNSRMAGAIFFDTRGAGENIYRPAQDCLKDYGQKINVNEIIELTATSYKEKLVEIIAPEKNLYAVCTHTLNYSDRFMVRDIKTRRLKK
jgi:hypothetical protein